MENKEQKEFYLMVKGQKVVVSEEVYRAYIQPVRAEQKREQRHLRCLVDKEVKGKIKKVMCRGNCSSCTNFRIESTAIISSLETMIDNGLDFDDKTIDIEQDCIDKEEIVLLHKAISQLNERQQEFIKLVFFDGLSQIEVAKHYGISYSAAKNAIKRILNHLKKILKN